MRSILVFLGVLTIACTVLAPGTLPHRGTFTTDRY